MTYVVHLVSMDPSRESAWSALRTATRPGDVWVLLDAVARHVRAGGALSMLPAGVRACLPQQPSSPRLAAVDALSADEWVHLIEGASSTLSWS